MMAQMLRILNFNDSWLFTSADEDDAMWLKAAEHMLHIYKEILDVFLLQMDVVLRGFCRPPFSKSGMNFLPRPWRKTVRYQGD